LNTDFGGKRDHQQDNKEIESKWISIIKSHRDNQVRHDFYLYLIVGDEYGRSPDTFARVTYSWLLKQMVKGTIKIEYADKNKKITLVNIKDVLPEEIFIVPCPSLF
jgi:hypothetical protein